MSLATLPALPTLSAHRADAPAATARRHETAWGAHTVVVLNRFALALLGTTEFVTLSVNEWRVKITACDITHPRAVRLRANHSIVSLYLDGVATDYSTRYSVRRLGRGIYIDLRDPIARAEGPEED